jgi:hypothetical protein
LRVHNHEVHEDCILIRWMKRVCPLTFSAPAAALSYWQIAVNDDEEVHGDCTRMYVVCMYQNRWKRFCLHAPTKKEWPQYNWLCLPLETTLDSFSELIEPFGTSVAGGALTDWMLAHSLTNFMSQRCWW